MIPGVGAITAWWAASRFRDAVTVLVKAAPWVAIGILIASFLVQRRTIVVTETKLVAATADVADFRRLATDATVPPAADGTRPLLSTPEAKAALSGAFRDRDDARKALNDIDRTTKAAKVRAAGDDAARTRVQTSNAVRYERARPEIERLAAAEPTGSPQTDAAAIEVDSRAAWEAWR